VGLTATRETFAGLSRVEIGVWYILSVASTFVFAYGVWRLVRRYRAARRPAEPVRRRVAVALHIVFTHQWIRRRTTIAGYAHLGVFYGFLVLFAGTTILAIQDDVVGPLTGWHFWRGWFYEGYSLFLDVFGMALVIGLSVLLVRRATGGVVRLTYARAAPRAATRYRQGDWWLVVVLLFLGVTGFALEALRIAVNPPPFEVWSPFGWIFGHALRDAGLSGSTADSARFAVWWVHGLAAISFVAAIPYTKAAHMLGGPVALAVRDDRPGSVLLPLPDNVQSDDVGYQRVGDLSPKHLVNLDACTRCGKCDEVCPANAGGWPLAPRSLILDLRTASLRGAATPLIPDAVDADTIWSCTQCMACVEICPVGIEHVPIINQVRRGLVEHGDLDAQLQATFEAVHSTGNSFGEPRRKRARWAKDADLPIKDARREAVEYLWFVGDYASLDPRNQENTRALATLLHRAGIDVGILYDAERTAGNDVRRAGEEVLFQTLVEQNLQTLADCSFQRIVTSDPHTFNTLKNEYPRLGATWTPDQVMHHSQLLLALLDGDAFGPVTPLGRRATYHDPCTLGRYNGVYDEPRAVLDRVGIELVEMPRNRDNSFCCGAGGGRIWMTTPKPVEGSTRPSEQRIDEAVSLSGVEWFVVACPKDVTMYEDAIKTGGFADRIALRELSQLVLAAVAPVPASAATT
jgi:Fe-S oxidoreductase